jgi:hypothetical protein
MLGRNGTRFLRRRILLGHSRATFPRGGPHLRRRDVLVDGWRDIDNLGSNHLPRRCRPEFHNSSMMFRLHSPPQLNPISSLTAAHRAAPRAGEEMACAILAMTRARPHQPQKGAHDETVTSHSPRPSRHRAGGGSSVSARLAAQVQPQRATGRQRRRSIRRSG